MEKQLPFEPDPLPALRSFTGWWLLLMALLLVLLLWLPDLSLAAPGSQILYLLHATLLLGYLHATPLQRRLNRLYLPIALCYAAFGAQVIQLISLRDVQEAFLSGQRRISEVVTIAHWLLLWPTVAVILGWKYRMRAVLLFALAMALFNIGIGMLLFPGAPFDRPSSLIAFGFLSIALLTVGYFARLLSRAEHHHRLALIEANRRLTQYASTLEQLTISRERNRMAHELHDTLAHTLSGVAVQLETSRVYWNSDPATARQLLEQALAATRDGLQETRRSLQALRASPLEDLGLRIALEQLAHTAAARAGLQLQLDLAAELPALSPAVEQCFYRIAQEAITNVVRHAAASCLRVSLQRSGPLELRIVDDGVGFDTTTASTRYGLLGMRERAALIGATLQIDSRHGAGTQVQLSLPDGSF